MNIDKNNFDIVFKDLNEEKLIEGKDYEVVIPAWQYMKYLGDENLLELINKEFDKFIAGEENTREAIFICNCSNFVSNLDSHFNLLVNGNSSAGKSWITKKVLSIFPESVFSKATYRTRISQKALTYWHNSRVEPEWTWDGKTLYLEDIGNDVLNCDVFKVMTSEGSLATIVTKKKIGGIEMPTTSDIEIIGKPTIVVTTAIGTPIEEIKNRFLIIDLDESEKQTDKIMEMQTLNALKTEKEFYNLHLKESLGKLKRVKVKLPAWILHIKDNLPRKDILRWRREFPRFLDIIKCSCALHQFQREKEGDFYLANEKDYEIARRVIGKISSSSGIEGLNHREKKAHEYVLEYYKKYNKGCTSNEIFAFKPVYTDRYWYSLLGKLSGKGLLSVALEKNPDTNRKATYYYPVEFKDLSLPSVAELTELIDKLSHMALRGIDEGTPIRDIQTISSVSAVIEIDEKIGNYKEQIKILEESGGDKNIIEMFKEDLQALENEKKEIEKIETLPEPEKPKINEKEAFEKNMNSFGF